jgi:hypothetical protein
MHYFRILTDEASPQSWLSILHARPGPAASLQRYSSCRLAFLGLSLAAAVGADFNTTVETDMSGVMVNITALHVAAAGGTTNQVKVVQLLLQAGCNANAHSSSYTITPHRCTWQRWLAASTLRRCCCSTVQTSTRRRVTPPEAATL